MLTAHHVAQRLQRLSDALEAQRDRNRIAYAAGELTAEGAASAARLQALVERAGALFHRARWSAEHRRPYAPPRVRSEPFGAIVRLAR